MVPKPLMPLQRYLIKKEAKTKPLPGRRLKARFEETLLKFQKKGEETVDPDPPPFHKKSWSE